MVEHSRRDPYLQSKYEQGVDAKIVIMGNTGMPPFIYLISLALTFGHASLSLYALCATRRGQDQLAASIHPKQVRTQEHHVHHRRIFRYEESLCKRCTSTPAAVGYSRAGEIPVDGTRLETNSNHRAVILNYGPALPRHLCTIEAQTPLYCCMILRTHLPLKMSADGWRVSLSPRCGLTRVRWSRADFLPELRVETKLFTGSCYLYCWL